jgi:ribosomal protein L15
MYEPMVMTDTVESISVEEANEMMTDEEAKDVEQLEINFAPEFREEYHGTKKAEINIDTISACFSAGDKVTLNTLKEKGLVSRQAGSVKILARGRLDKPLTVVAQKFSVAAVKMIAMTGGSVIVAESAPERNSR